MEVVNSGLTESLVRRRQEEEGLNIFPQSKPKSFSHLVLEVIKEPMVFLLLGCGVIYFFMGDAQEAIMLLGFLILIIGITIFQERKAEKALEALRDLSSPRAQVLREGIKTRIAGIDVVRGDTIFINEGDRVPADAKIIESLHLAVDESLLTGESLPVYKTKDSHVFAGSSAVSGQGIAIVEAIGIRTELGKIGKSLQQSEEEKSNLEQQIKKIVYRVAWFAITLCLLVVFFYALNRQDWIRGFLVGLTLAMAILPNELPAVLTIFLALGAWRMSQRRVLTRKLSAIENLGSATVLCVDKTGTLTLNQMSIQKIYTQEEYFDTSRSGLNILPEIFHEALEFGILASKKDPFDPMELAFVSAGEKYLHGSEHLHQDWSIEKEYPLTPELLSISLAWKTNTGGEFIIGAKGAPETIIDLCHLSENESSRLLKKAEAMATEGLRVLGIAKSLSPIRPLPSNQHDFPFTFVGFIGIADPIRPEVPEAIQECHKAGIRVIMITGDHPNTAKHIAKKIGIQNPSFVLTGLELEKMSPHELSLCVGKGHVFSRVSPQQKLQIVMALKANGEVVAMTGDGVNDAPALKSAHIGIAMGKRGTDVARESAALVLVDDDFGSIVEAIRMGRRVYDNLKSALIYLSAVHIPIAGMSVIPVVFDLPIILLPAHIALLHLIIEPASSIAFEVAPARINIMTEPPRNPKENLFNKKLWLPALLQGFSNLIALTIVLILVLRNGGDEKMARTLVFSTLIISNLMLIFLNSRSEYSIWKGFKIKENQIAIWISIMSISMLALVIYLSSLSEIFRFSPLSLRDVIICVVVGVLSVLWIEFIPKKRN